MAQKCRWRAQGKSLFGLWHELPHATGFSSLNVQKTLGKITVCFGPKPQTIWDKMPSILGVNAVEEEKTNTFVLFFSQLFVTLPKIS